MRSNKWFCVYRMILPHKPGGLSPGQSLRSSRDPESLKRCWRASGLCVSFPVIETRDIIPYQLKTSGETSHFSDHEWIKMNSPVREYRPNHPESPWRVSRDDWRPDTNPHQSCLLKCFFHSIPSDGKQTQFSSRVRSWSIFKCYIWYFTCI